MSKQYPVSGLIGYLWKEEYGGLPLAVSWCRICRIHAEFGTVQQSIWWRSSIEKCSLYVGGVTCKNPIYSSAIFSVLITSSLMSAETYVCSSVDLCQFQGIVNLYHKSSCLYSKSVNSYWNSPAFSQRQKKKNFYYLRCPSSKLSEFCSLSLKDLFRVFLFVYLLLLLGVFWGCLVFFFVLLFFP